MQLVNHVTKRVLPSCCLRKTTNIVAENWGMSKKRANTTPRINKTKSIASKKTLLNRWDCEIMNAQNHYPTPNLSALLTPLFYGHHNHSSSMLLGAVSAMRNRRSIAAAATGF